MPTPDEFFIDTHGDSADVAANNQFVEELAQIQSLTRQLHSPEAIATTECIQCSRTIEKIRKEANASAVICLRCVRKINEEEKKARRF